MARWYQEMLCMMMSCMSFISQVITMVELVAMTMSALCERMLNAWTMKRRLFELGRDWYTAGQVVTASLLEFTVLAAS